MFKIVVADDEPVIIKGLKKLISWESLDTKIVGEAKNGEELLSLIREVSPDIIISDVSMPKLSGLDVIQELREKGSTTKVIFLSGYQEFDYVRTAIRYAAQEYLLKPVGKEELEAAVLKAEQSLRAENPIKYWQEEKNDMQTVFRKMNRESECRELYGHFKEMGLETEGKQFTGVTFSLPGEFYKKVDSQSMAELLRFSLFKKLQEQVKREKLGFVIKREVNSSNMILISEKGSPQEDLEREILRIREKIQQDYGIRMILGIGDTVEQIRELKFAYKTAKFSAELYYFTQEELIRYRDVNREFHCSFEDYNQAYKELVTEIFNRDGEWKEKLEETLEIVENLHYGNRYAAENRCIVMVMELYRELEEYHLVSEEARQEYEQLAAKIRNQRTYQEVKKVIRKGLSELMEKQLFRDAALENQTIREVKEYIRKHYGEDLTLTVLAGVAYMNPYYFSAFFKKETGQNFKNYVAEVRMKEAVRLLMETDMKTYELAKAVGYKDVRCFTDKFREYYKDSPAGYKRAMEKNREKQD